MQLPPPFVAFRVFQINAIVTCRYTSGFQPRDINQFWRGADRYITYTAVSNLLYLSVRWGWFEYSGVLYCVAAQKTLNINALHECFNHFEDVITQLCRYFHKITLKDLILS